MAVLADISDAVVAALNGHTFSMPFTAARSYRPVYTREEMKDLHVTVVPGGYAMENLGRGQVQEDYTVEIAVQQAPETMGNVALDSLVGLVEEIRDFFLANRRMAAMPSVICMKAAFAAGSDRGYAPEHLDQLQQFTSILALTFRVMG
ncbi:MAG: hypothetical protein NT049_08750 [Planctomycetota bacterium]|nr:hypothetical protein [Planctomycetota bacterium]